MGAKFKKVLLTGAAFAALGWLGAMDYSEALIQEAIEKEARPARAAAMDRSLPFAIPLDYKAVVCQRTYYSERATCRYYSERSK